MLAVLVLTAAQLATTTRAYAFHCPVCDSPLHGTGHAVPVLRPRGETDPAADIQGPWLPVTRPRGSTWSYVIRVTDPRTGLSKPKWVGGFATEAEAKAARDEARVNARRGQYVERNPVTVGAYLDMWIEGHAVEIKPKTLAGYRDLLDDGGKNGRPLSASVRRPSARDPAQGVERCCAGG
ncbi:Arm DNA-binding domain-containing protein [Jiangella endophytica]|uniref:Arm DNA-binding domain-containing protein n=1 Tax=Jiangella endophytica TaxID=1623398 RepID=UPI0038CC1A32